jgi:mRNA interferase MazF
MTLENNTAKTNESLRGDIWTVELDPTIGDEIKKTRRCVIISADAIASLKVKLVVPLKTWKPSHDNMFWHVPIEPTVRNGLQRKSSADLLQTRCVSINRLIEKKGYVSADLIDDIVAALAALIEYV